MLFNLTGVNLEERLRDLQLRALKIIKQEPLTSKDLDELQKYCEEINNLLALITNNEKKDT